MKLLNGSDLAGFIKERQLRAVRGLRQSAGVNPKLAIIRTNADPVVDIYMRLKQRYGDDIDVQVDVHQVELSEAASVIERLNADPSVHGIVVQLPLPDRSQTEMIVNSVSAAKDVDGLAANSDFDPATPTAIYWLLSGYNIDLIGKKVLIIGQGRLVGAPLARMWRASGLDIETADESVANLAELTIVADVIVTATGQPGLLTASMIKRGAVVVDAGVADDRNKLTGDLADDVRSRDDLTITPEKGGVGPLTICALFENVITAARRQAEDAKDR